MLPKNITIRPLSMADYEKAVELWSTIEGLKLNESDTPEAVESLLARNPDFSTVATDKEEIVGAVLCGHNGRAGQLYHPSIRGGLNQFRESLRQENRSPAARRRPR